MTPDGYIACGSEDNSVYAYTATLPTPLARHCFSSSEGCADSVRRPPYTSFFLGVLGLLFKLWAAASAAPRAVC